MKGKILYYLTNAMMIFLELEFASGKLMWYNLKI